MQPKNLQKLISLKTQLYKTDIIDREQRVKLAEANRDGELKRLIRKKIEYEDILNCIQKIKKKKLKLLGN